MGKKRMSTKQIEEIYTWLDNNLDLPERDNTNFYEAFPDRKRALLRNDKLKWKKRKEEESLSEKAALETNDIQLSSLKKDRLANTDIQVQNEPTGSATTSKSIESNNTESSQEMPDELTQCNLNKITNESKNTIIDSFISELFCKRETLIKILNKYEKTGSLPLVDIKLEGPFKTVSFSLMENTISDFTRVCKDLGVSQRKAVHLAFNDFIQKHDSDSIPS